MFHIFLSLQSYMFFGIIISFSGISNAGSNEKSCLISMSCVLTYIDVRTLKFFRPAQFWLVNSNFQHSCRKQDCVVRRNLLFCLLSRLTSRPAPLLPHRRRAPEQFENAILFLRLGQPSKLICHERELFGNALTNRRNLKMIRRLSVDGKHFENGVLRKWWHYDNHAWDFRDRVFQNDQLLKRFHIIPALCGRKTVWSVLMRYIVSIKNSNSLTFL